MAIPKELWSRIDQIGIVGRDAESVIASMRTIFGLEPTKHIQISADKTDAVYRDKPRVLCAHLIFYRISDIDLEIICPTAGASLHHEYLEKHGEGLYHIRFDVESFDEAVRAMTERGYPPAMYGTSANNSSAQWAYFDTEPELGYYIEIINLREIHAGKAE
ncbi:VOC family protein [uncultured Oscillibacter sp.]|uniref:VOC family protein n=1 Tax=uncultured Oscillibacter sp. TaxID=876091 RepID=UPI002618BD0F|nr:VOC family protein [uncultured Oscillibacter sp.]